MPSWITSTCARASPTIRFPRALSPFLEYLERCDDADEAPLEVRQLVTPSIEPVGVDEYVIDQHVVPGTCKGSNGCPHSSREPLARGS